MDVIELFPISIAQFQYTNHSNLKTLVNEIIQDADKSDITVKDFSNHYFENNRNFLENPKLLDFKNFLIKSATQYINDFLEIDSEIILPLCWINCANAGHRLEKHNHGNSYISGTYYLNFDQLEHAPLTFYKSVLGNSHPYFDSIPTNYNIHNAGRCELSHIQEGDLFLWPSHVEHGYEKNQNDNRISISMNFLPSIINNGTYKFKITQI